MAFCVPPSLSLGFKMVHIKTFKEFFFDKGQKYNIIILHNGAMGNICFKTHRLQQQQNCACFWVKAVFMEK